MKLPAAKLLAIAAGSFAFTTLAWGEEFTLRIGAGHPTPAVTYVYVADTFFVPEVIKRVKEKTGHDIKFIKAYAGTVAKVDGIVEAVQKGTLDIGLVVTGFEQAHVPLLNYGVFFPFTTTDHVLNAKVAQRMLKEVPALQATAKAYNATILNQSVAENYGVTSKTQFSKIDDLKGKRLAVAGANAPWVQVIGAIPIQITIGENYQGMKTGLVDGNVGFIAYVDSYRFYEVAKSFVKVGFGTSIISAMLMNNDTRARLPKEVVAIFDEVGDEAGIKQAEVAKQRDESAEALLKSKISIDLLSDSDRKHWAEAVKDISSKQAKELDAKGIPGTSVFKSYVQFLKEAGYTFPMDMDITH